MVRESKRRKQNRASLGKLKTPHSNFVNSKKDPMIVTEDIMEKDGTKVKADGFLSIKLEEGKRAWARIG